jgi:SnoaL-like polyketide cyclase
LLGLRGANIMGPVNSVAEANKHKVRMFVEAVRNQGQLELIDELVAADYIGRIPCFPARIVGREGVHHLVSSQRLIYPDLYIKLEDEIAEDDRVVARWQATGTAQGPETADSPATRHRCCEGITIIRLPAGKQVDAHTQCTGFAAVHQLWQH